jgi:predicted kinase
MVIFLGGLVGSGRRRLARQLAQALDYAEFDLDRALAAPAHVHMHRAFGNSDLAVPLSSELMRAYRQFADALPKLEIMHNGVVAHATFHSADSRDMLWNAARKVSRDVRIVWIEPDKETLDIQLRRFWRNGRAFTVDAAKALRHNIVAVCEPLPHEIPVFHLRHDDPQPLSSLIQLRRGA